MSVRISDLDVWRRVCLTAFDNLSTDTEVTMSQVDRVLVTGAREYVTLPETVTDDGQTKLIALLARVAEATGVAQNDVDAILYQSGQEAAALIADPS